MKLTISKKPGVRIQPGMIGLFFEDINYAADGGLYAELIENRSFEFLEAEGDARDYYTHYDGGYGWSAYVPETMAKSSESRDGRPAVRLRTVMGSPLTQENPHYMRLETMLPMCGLANQAYEGIYLKEGMGYHITFWARCVSFTGNFCIQVVKDGQVCAQGSIAAAAGREETYNFYRKYELNITALQGAQGGLFVLCLDQPGVVELDYVSMIPEDAVAGIFRKDLFEKLRDLKPGFIRFPGGCIVEGNTLENRYRFKDSLKEPWARKNNWNRWAVHGNHEENGYHSVYSHYNQTLGLGYYEFFLLCELIGAKPLPVLNVGFACQYQSVEKVSMDSPQFQEFLQDAIDLIEFANGSADTKWGAVRAKLGHCEPFGLSMIGIGNEQWQTKEADFFERYIAFEKVIHDYDPDIRLIGSAGPDVTSQHYTEAWEFYRTHVGDAQRGQENFVYGVDEHYYVKPQWLFEHVNFYDEYPREVKVFSGEYAAHPFSGMNRPDANTLEGALAEAAFLTGVERNADVVVLASYAPLFARTGYAQWSPDMIWFDGETSYATPSYYVQQMYASNMGDWTLDTEGQEKQAAAEGIFYSASYEERSDTVILKLVNSNKEAVRLELKQEAEPKSIEATVLTAPELNAVNSLDEPDMVRPVRTAYAGAEQVLLPPYSFSVLRIRCYCSEANLN